MRKTLIALPLLALAMAVTGCDSTKTLKQENSLLREENDTLRGQLEDRNSALDATNSELRDRDIQLAQMRTDMDSRPVSGPTGFEGIEGVSGTMDAGEVTVAVESDILFDSGKTTLKSSAKSTLDAVVDVLNMSYSARPIQVAGHTDSDPIRKSGFKSNYHLGFERAYAVREYLVTQGVPRNRVFLASFGPNDPRGTKQDSRRVEIVVVLN